MFDLDGVLVDSEPVWEEVRREVVAAHGGRIELDSTPGQGTTCTVSLPRATVATDSMA